MIRTLSRRLAFAAVLIGSGVHPPARTGAAVGVGVVAFTHVSLLPMDSSRVLRDQTVIVRGDTIARVGAAGTTDVPPGAAVIDGRGKYLMPGLTDMHVHVDGQVELLSDLVWGVTTVAVFRGGPEYLRLRAALAQGTVLGPTMYTSGNIIDGSPPGSLNSIEVATEAEARTVIDAQKRAGYDYIKVYSFLRPEAYRALLAEAKAQGMTVVGHIPRAVGAEEALRDGQALIAHAEEYYFTYFHSRPDSAAIPAIVAQTRAAGAWVVAMLSSTPFILRTVANNDSIMAVPEARYLPPSAYQEWRTPNNNYVNRSDPAAFAARVGLMGTFLPGFTKALDDGHVPLLIGTDAASLNFPGWGVHDELRQLVAAGISPYEALRIATRNAGAYIAERVRPNDHFGTVAPGMRADLVLLSANPLADIVNVDSLVGVMARGRWWTVADLKQRRDRATHDYGALDTMVARFDSLIAAGDVPGARSVFDEATRRAPDASIFSHRILLYLAKGLLARDPRGALEVCRMNVQLYPERFSSYNALGRALLATHDTAAARDAFERSLELVPGNDAGLRMLDSITTAH